MCNQLWDALSFTSSLREREREREEGRMREGGLMGDKEGSSKRRRKEGKREGGRVGRKKSKLNRRRKGSVG